MTRTLVLATAFLAAFGVAALGTPTTAAADDGCYGYRGGYYGGYSSPYVGYSSGGYYSYPSRGYVVYGSGYQSRPVYGGGYYGGGYYSGGHHGGGHHGRNRGGFSIRF